jgi:hypothetical protein
MDSIGIPECPPARPPNRSADRKTSRQTLSSAGFTTDVSGFRFSVHTTENPIRIDWRKESPNVSAQ